MRFNLVCYGAVVLDGMAHGARTLTRNSVWLGANASGTEQEIVDCCAQCIIAHIDPDHGNVGLQLGRAFYMWGRGTFGR